MGRHGLNDHRVRMNPEEYDQLRREILERDGWRCQRCGRREQLDVHHVISRARAGADAENNLITLCRSCHRVLHASGTAASDFMR